MGGGYQRSCEDRDGVFGSGSRSLTCWWCRRHGSRPQPWVEVEGDEPLVWSGLALQWQGHSVPWPCCHRSRRGPDGLVNSSGRGLRGKPPGWPSSSSSKGWSAGQLVVCQVAWVPGCQGRSRWLQQPSRLRCNRRLTWRGKCRILPHWSVPLCMLALLAAVSTLASCSRCSGPWGGPCGSVHKPLGAGTAWMAGSMRHQLSSPLTWSGNSLLHGWTGEVWRKTQVLTSMSRSSSD